MPLERIEGGCAVVERLLSRGVPVDVLVFRLANDGGEGLNRGRVVPVEVPTLGRAIQGRGAGRTARISGGASSMVEVRNVLTRGAAILARRRWLGAGSREVPVPILGRSVAATSGAQGLAPGVGADDGAAASGCGVRRASTFNPPATRGEEGQLHRI